ncbi:MAG: hypothetical protein AAGK14_07955 [Verrucomicrobiota bacterium]
MTLAPTNSFRTLAGVPVHYARPPVAPYGTRGQARRWLSTLSFERRLDAAFGELWERCPLGPAAIITSAGAWVDKPGYHGLGRGFDLDALFWPVGTAPRDAFVALHYPKDLAFYLGVESVLRRHFGTVLQYLYNAAHRDHFHVDDGTPVAWRSGSRSRVLYLQSALTHLHAAPVAIDGLHGPETAAATRTVLRRLGLGESLERAATWRDFLAAGAERGFALALGADDPAPDAPPAPPRLRGQLVELDEQVEMMRATSQAQYTRLREQIRTLLTHPELAPAEETDVAVETVPRFRVRGRMSTFGGPDDAGVAPDEGLALFAREHVHAHPELFLPAQPRGTSGLARRLNPEARYLACRWDYTVLPKALLRSREAVVRNPATGAEARARPVDWGPAEWTGRVADLSPGLARKLGLATDDEAEVILE